MVFLLVVGSLVLALKWKNDNLAEILDPVLLMHARLPSYTMTQKMYHMFFLSRKRLHIVSMIPIRRPPPCYTPAATPSKTLLRTSPTRSQKKHAGLLLTTLPWQHLHRALKLPPFHPPSFSSPLAGQPGAGERLAHCLVKPPLTPTPTSY